MLELLHTNNGVYDAACAMDFFWEVGPARDRRRCKGGWGPRGGSAHGWRVWLVRLALSCDQFYDNFATRDRRGHPPATGYPPYFAEPADQALVWANAAVPVYACWNGLVAMNALPFKEARSSSPTRNARPRSG